jgi:hypothetical protein
MNHEAVYALYPNVVSINDTTPYDADGNEVTIDLDAVNSWVSPEQYQRDRASAYPSIQEQLDMQYWDSVNGTTTWADAIAKVKADYPKGAE